MDRRIRSHLENAFHSALVGARADGGFVGALAEQELHRAEDHGFAGTGLARDGCESRLRLPEHVLDEGEVADA